MSRLKCKLRIANYQLSINHYCCIEFVVYIICSHHIIRYGFFYFAENSTKTDYYKRNTYVMMYTAVNNLITITINYTI
jgi:hypothetical protein